MGRENAWERYTVLLCSCLLTFGSYYCFDMPSVLEEQITMSIIDQGVAKGGPAGDCGNTDGPFYYNLFYTVYAWCNMAMSLVAGVLVDRWGLVPCAFLFISLCIVGQALYALGPTLTVLSPTNQYVVMFAGRFIFGLGGGSITIVQNTISAYWFAGRELAMAFGCTLTVSRLGSVVNFNLTTFIFNSFLAIFTLDPNAQDFCSKGGATVNATWVPATENDLQICRTTLGATFFLGMGLISLSLLAAACWLRLHRREQREALQKQLMDPLMADGAGPQRKKMRFSDIKELPVTYWLCAIIICSFYNDVFPFMGIVKSYLSNSKGQSTQAAGSTASIVYLMSAVVSPFLGRAVDHFGRRGSLAIAGTTAVIPCFALLAFTDVTPVIPMVLLGSAYCVCAAVLWPSIQFLVKPHVVGTANGIATSIQMFGIGVCNIIVGQLMSAHTTGCGPDKKIDYKPTMVFFLGMACVSVVLAIVLKTVDACGSNRLRRGQVERLRLGSYSHVNADHDDFDEGY